MNIFPSLLLNHRLKKVRRRMPLWMEIGLVLLVKCALLFLLWQQFFAHPPTKHMRLPAETVQQHFFSPQPQSALPATDQTATQHHSPAPEFQPMNEVRHGTH